MLLFWAPDYAALHPGYLYVNGDASLFTVFSAVETMKDCNQLTFKI